MTTASTNIEQYCPAIIITHPSLADRAFKHLFRAISVSIADRHRNPAATHVVKLLQVLDEGNVLSPSPTINTVVCARRTFRACLPRRLGAVDIYLNAGDCELFFVLTRRGEEE